MVEWWTAAVLQLLRRAIAVCSSSLRARRPRCSAGHWSRWKDQVTVHSSTHNLLSPDLFQALTSQIQLPRKHRHTRLMRDYTCRRGKRSSEKTAPSTSSLLATRCDASQQKRAPGSVWTPHTHTYARWTMEASPRPHHSALLCCLALCCTPPFVCCALRAPLRHFHLEHAQAQHSGVEAAVDDEVGRVDVPRLSCEDASSVLKAPVVELPMARSSALTPRPVGDTSE